MHCPSAANLLLAQPAISEFRSPSASQDSSGDHQVTPETPRHSCLDPGVQGRFRTGGHRRDRSVPTVSGYGSSHAGDICHQACRLSRTVSHPHTHIPCIDLPGSDNHHSSIHRQGRNSSHSLFNLVPSKVWSLQEHQVQTHSSCSDPGSQIDMTPPVGSLKTPKAPIPGMGVDSTKTSPPSSFTFSSVAATFSTLV